MSDNPFQAPSKKRKARRKKSSTVKTPSPGQKASPATEAAPADSEPVEFFEPLGKGDAAPQTVPFQISEQQSADLTVDESLPPLSLEEESCRSCRYFYFKEGAERVHASSGECRRHAPSPGRSLVASWPVTSWKSWCGEWDNGVSNEDMVRMARDIGEQLENVGFSDAEDTED